MTQLHENWCREHPRPPLDDTSRLITGCVGAIEAQVPPFVAAWLSRASSQTMVELDHQPGVAIPVQEYLTFSLQSIAMALRGGAVMLPRPAIPLL